MSVIGTTVQQLPYQSYDRGECRSYLCNASTSIASCDLGDWAYRFRLCGMCPSQPSCSKPDPSLCPLIGGQGATNVEFNQAPNINCIYSPNQFKTSTDLLTWEATFGKDNTYNNIIMPAFCSKETSVGCPKNESGRIQTTCSILRAETPAGQLCRNWAVDHPELANEAAKNYCQNHDTFECACFNRGNDLEYQSFKQYVPNVPDSCWYRPCTVPTYNFIPSELKNIPCPLDVCQKIQDGYHNEQYRFLNPSDAQDSTICPLNTTEKNLIESSSGSSSWWVFFLIIIVVLILIVVGYFLYPRS